MVAHRRLDRTSRKLTHQWRIQDNLFLYDRSSKIIFDYFGTGILDGSEKNLTAGTDERDGTSWFVNGEYVTRGIHLPRFSCSFLTKTWTKSRRQMTGSKLALVRKVRFIFRLVNKVPRSMTISDGIDFGVVSGSMCFLKHFSSWNYDILSGPYRSLEIITDCREMSGFETFCKADTKRWKLLWITPCFSSRALFRLKRDVIARNPIDLWSR